MDREWTGSSGVEKAPCRHSPDPSLLRDGILRYTTAARVHRGASFSTAVQGLTSPGAPPARTLNVQEVGAGRWQAGCNHFVMARMFARAGVGSSSANSAPKRP